MHAATRSTHFNDNWQFILEDVPAAKEASFDSSAWRTLKVPHDWSVELSFTQEKAGGSTAYLPGGIGWYRKSFTLPESAKEQVTWIEFDGIYNNAEVWINGHYLGMRPYGYVAFSYDLSQYLNFGDTPNVIAVKVDRSAYLDCRWYPGSGIYRDVKLVSAPKVHIPQWGTFVTTPVATAERAEVKVQTTVSNTENEAREVELTTEIDGQTQSRTVSLQAGATEVVEQVFEICTPRLWDTENPNLYVAKSTLSSGDHYSTTFGIRDIHYDKDRGFFLNGHRTVFKGVCLHHDGGAVGAAVPLNVWKRRLEILKDYGCNAIRTAHNPPSEEFLDLCDQMGFLVQDEIFDEWDHPKDKKHNYKQLAASEETEGYTRYFREWEKADTDSMMLRDRNHPSIVMWSIGNEIEWTYPGYTDATGYWNKDEQAKGIDYYLTEPPYDDAKRQEIFNNFDRGDYELAETAERLAGYVRALDTTRPLTGNMVLPTVALFSGYTDVMDVDGYSYRQSVYQFCRERSPDKLIIGTENWAQWSEWKPVLDHEYIAGIFIWTGIAYLGEAQEWPQKANTAGMFDLATFETPKALYFKTLWTEEPMVAITSMPLADSNYLLEGDRIIENKDKPREPYWGWPELNFHWNYTDGEQQYVEVYSNAESVELLLNGESLGTVKITDNEDRIFRWVVPFAAGNLTAIARNGDTVVSEQVLKTAGPAATIQVHSYESQLSANGEAVAHVIAQVIDAEGTPVRHTESTLSFDIDGDATRLAIDNGSPYSVQDYRADSCTTAQGRCLYLVTAGTEAGEINVTASGDGLQSASVTIQQVQ
ncbi:sugar-binding domain-containing protein [Coraliomargarita akajimensis]|nr:sugar-binding domain-containing protein [Coraliomargarita akajimensis]